MEVPEKRQVQRRSTKSKWWNAISIQFYIHIISYIFCLVCSHAILTRTRIVGHVAGPPLPILTLWLPAPRQGIPKEVTKQTTTKVAEVIESQRARLQTRSFFLLFVVHLESRKPKLARGTGHTRGNTLYVFNFWVEDRAGQQGPQKNSCFRVQTNSLGFLDSWGSQKAADASRFSETPKVPYSIATSKILRDSVYLT